MLCGLPQEVQQEHFPGRNNEKCHVKKWFTEDEWMGGGVDGWAVGWMNQWMNGRKDGWTDG